MRCATSTGMVYERRGEGRPVVLLHGWCLNGRLWTYEDERLAAAYETIVPDLPGFGRSDAADGPYTIDRYATEVLALLEELDLRGAAVTGFAFGALVAMAAAAVDDSRIAGLALVGIPSASRFAYDRMPAAMRRDWPEFARRSARAICTGAHSEATFDWLTRMFEATPLHVAIAVNNGVLGVVEPVLLAREISVPTLFIHGAQDGVVPLEVAEQCASAMRRASVEAVAECGHLVLLDQKGLFHEMLEAFLGEL